MLDALFYGLLELDGMSDAGSGVVGSACAGDELVHVEGVLLVAERRGLGDGAVGSGRGALAAGHAVDVVAHHDNGDVNVALRGVDEVVAADTGAVAVAGEDNNLLVGVDGLQTLGLSKSAAVQGVQAVHVNIYGSPGGAADAADKTHFVLADVQLVKDAQEGVDDYAVAAAGAEYERKGLLTDVFLCDTVHITSPQRSFRKLLSERGTRRRWS